MPLPAHLTPADIESIGKELDAIRDEVIASRGESDRAYIKKVIKGHRTLETAARVTLLGSLFPPAWLAGTTMLSVAKILENMELGHNILHGQWDWMRDPEIHSTTWDWDNVTPAADWKHTHNYLHHTYTNIIGMDRDLGYQLLRISPDQRWYKYHLAQVPMNIALMFMFEYGIALYDMEIGKAFTGKMPASEIKAHLGKVWKKVKPQVVKDLVVWPLLSGPSALTTLAANVTANVVRNVWTHSVIFCGHFPDEVQEFTIEETKDETRGGWYVRQLLGSANLEGGKAFNLMTGQLSFQIEHHLFPDLPSNRYAEIAPRVRSLCERYDLPYVTGPMPKQLAQVWVQLAKMSLPPKQQPAHPKKLATSSKQIAKAA